MDINEAKLVRPSCWLSTQPLIMQSWSGKDFQRNIFSSSFFLFCASYLPWMMVDWNCFHSTSQQGSTYTSRGFVLYRWNSSSSRRRSNDDKVNKQADQRDFKRNDCWAFHSFIKQCIPMCNRLDTALEMKRNKEKENCATQYDSILVVLLILTNFLSLHYGSLLKPSIGLCFIQFCVLFTLCVSTVMLVTMLCRGNRRVKKGTKWQFKTQLIKMLCLLLFNLTNFLYLKYINSMV